ncbi:MAG: hypothetical protein ACWA5Q_10510 [bacterium]
MDEKTLRALVEAGAIKQVSIIADGAIFHVEAKSASGLIIAKTHKGKIKTWSSIDSAPKWLRKLGIGSAALRFELWHPH